MANERLKNALQQIRRLAAGGESGQSTDHQLLTRFVRERDEAAFAAMVKRHAAMVFGVCRRVLRHAADAEDAAQATFLVLAQKSGSIVKSSSVSSWLHTVAYRVARRLRAAIARRKDRERGLVDGTAADPAQEATWREVQLILDEELQRLPEKYRAPLVLCFLEGMTQDEAARQLGWPHGVLRGRLDRGRARLRSQLIRRGVTLPAALLGTALAESTRAGTISSVFVESTARAAALVAADQAAAHGAIPAQVAALAEEVSSIMFAQKLRTAALALLVVGVLSGLLGFYSLAGQRADDKPASTNLADNVGIGKKAKPAEAADGVRVVTALKEIGEAVEPSDRVEIQPGLVRILVFKEKPSRISLSGGDKIASFNLVGESGRQISFLGRSHGSAIAYVWFGNEKAGERQKILSLSLEVAPHGVDEGNPEAKPAPRKPSKMFDKYVKQIIDPKETISLKLGESRLIILKEMPKRIQVADDEIATFTFLPDKQFMLEAKKAGATILNLWFFDATGGIKESVYSSLILVEPLADGRTKLDPQGR